MRLSEALAHLLHQDGLFGAGRRIHPLRKGDLDYRGGDDACDAFGGLGPEGGGSGGC